MTASYARLAKEASPNWNRKASLHLAGIGIPIGGQTELGNSRRDSLDTRFPRAFRAASSAASANYSFPLIIDRDFPNQKERRKRRRERRGEGRSNISNANKTHVQLTNWQITRANGTREGNPLDTDTCQLAAMQCIQLASRCPLSPPLIPCPTWVLLIAQLRHAIDVQRVNDGWLRPRLLPLLLPPFRAL